MSRNVCFFDEEFGQTAICVMENETVLIKCKDCEHNPFPDRIVPADRVLRKTQKSDKEKIDRFIGELEDAYIRGNSVVIQIPTGEKITIDHSAIPDIHLWMIEDKQKEVSHVALAHARSKRRVPFEYQSLTEEEYFQMRRGWQESKQRNREARYERNERSFSGHEAELLNRVNERRYRRDHERH